MADSTVYRIEHQRTNGDWTEVGSINSADLEFAYPERALEVWLQLMGGTSPGANREGRYRVIERRSYGAGYIFTEFTVGEKREWVVERANDERPQVAEDIAVLSQAAMTPAPEGEA